MQHISKANTKSPFPMEMLHFYAEHRTAIPMGFH
jgi:hypothetical protein